jgi:hypothetical protein
MGSFGFDDGEDVFGLLVVEMRGDVKPPLLSVTEVKSEPGEFVFLEHDRYHARFLVSAMELSDHLRDPGASEVAQKMARSLS